MNDDEDSVESNVLQVRILLKLSTECTDRSLQVPSDVIAVPADAGRKQISAVLNHLLDRRGGPPRKADDEEENEDEDEDDKLPAIPFDCFVGKGSNRLLRTGIEREARRSGLTLEEAIVVTYFPATPAPETSGESEPVPDWISCLSYIPSRRLVCAACYDGSILVYSDREDDDDDGTMDASSLQLVATKSLAHQGPIHCLATAASAAMTSTTTNKVWIATGSMDHTLQLHTINDDSSNIDVALHASCTGGHSSAITSVDINGQTQSLASGDWDGNLCLWDFGSTVATANTPAAKKSKTGTSTSSTAASSHQAQAPTLRPKASIRAHTSNISGISWGNHLQTTTHATAGNDAQNLHHLITGSWDHSIKVWDMERQDCLLTLNGSRVVSCLDTSYHSAGIVATGHPDCTVRLWDTRTTTTATTDDAAKPSSLAVFADTTFRPSHKEWITAVQWSRDNPYHLASTSHDGTVKLWDIRSALPLHTYRAFAKKDKGLSLCYGSSSSSKSNSENSNTIYVGGTDCIVKQLQCAR